MGTLVARQVFGSHRHPRPTISPELPIFDLVGMCTSERTTAMGTKSVKVTGTTAARDVSELLKQYECGPIQLMGDDGLYERHLLFDNLKHASAIVNRERYEAIARSLRDVLSQRWILTEKT